MVDTVSTTPLRFHILFSKAAIYLGAALSGFLPWLSHDGAKFALRWFLGSAFAMWCVVDSSRHKQKLSHGLEWQAALGGGPIVALVYVHASRGWPGVRRATKHATLLLLLMAVSYVIGAALFSQSGD